ncbi:hypothetical protein JW933_06585 [candidate division FCPU426 bacterium]|nr:hypothetical protein [candidate division FCPU426 bacterium]
MGRTRTFPAALTGWIIGKNKDAFGSPDRMDYWEEQGRLRQYLRHSDSNEGDYIHSSDLQLLTGRPSAVIRHDLFPVIA